MKVKYSPAYIRDELGETVAIVGSLLSLVGALVAVGAPQQWRKVAT